MAGKRLVCGFKQCMKHTVLIAGGGIVGLATAYRMLHKMPDLQIIVLEKDNELARHQTGHNSGVIHSGIYYKPGSLKAVNCIRGYAMLLDFCQAFGIHYELCGKIIVATRKEELPTLEMLLGRGQANGLSGLKKLNAGQLKEFEPHVTGLAGIFVPQTGIVDYRQVALKLAEQIQAAGAHIVTAAKVLRLAERDDQVVITTTRGEYAGNVFVNCAGLYSDTLALQTFPELDVRIVPFRGEYYKLKKDKEHLVRNLIYPVPDPSFPFLGVHFTRLIGGGVEAGPNAVLALKREGYKKSDFSLREFTQTLAWPGFRKVAAKYWQTGLEELYRSFSKAAFTKALQRLIPEVQEDDLIEAGAGVRAQACHRNGTLLDDFLILENKRFVHVCNAPSPAATSSLSIGDYISDKVITRFQ